jgi:hypothetical protein
MILWDIIEVLVIFGAVALWITFMKYPRETIRAMKKLVKWFMQRGGIR